MKEIFSSLLALSVVFFSINSICAGQKKEKDKVLASKIYTIEIYETGGKKASKHEQDEISFKNDKLNSKFISGEYKFPASPYTVSVDSSSSPHTITFESETKNQNEEELKWEGTITGEDIEGTAIISKKGKTKKEYYFLGNLKVKAGKK